MNQTAAIHVAKKQLGLDEENYRAVLARITGKASTKAMNDAERDRVLAEFRRLGFKPKPPTSRRKLAGKYAAKLQALWIAGWNLGLITNRSDAALTAFVTRQTGIDAVRFLRDGDDAAKAIEALKGWLSRGAGVDWSNTISDPVYQQTSGCKIAFAQWRKLFDGMPAISWAKFFAEAGAIAGRPAPQLEREADWVPVMNEFGRRIRAKQGEA